MKFLKGTFVLHLTTRHASDFQAISGPVSPNDWFFQDGVKACC